MPDKSTYSRLIKQEAHRLGFQYCGISKAARLDEEAEHLEKWLKKGRHGKMKYMENHFEKRVDPTKLVPGAQSVVSVLYNYYTDEKPENPEALRISRYAYGEDYHFVMKRKLKALIHYIREEIGDVQGRCFVDSAPVLDRAWAQRSGLGWMGKHTMILNREAGSYFFIGELILDLPLDPDGPVKDYCGTCTRCIDACPTDAIKPYEVDGSKCISYFTIELKENDEIPDEFSGKFGNWAFGCDICQEVCPWNRFAQKHNEPAFDPAESVLNMSRKAWQEMTEEVFHKVFKRSPLKRTKYKGMQRNIRFLEKGEKKDKY